MLVVPGPARPVGQGAGAVVVAAPAWCGGDARPAARGWGSHSGCPPRSAGPLPSPRRGQVALGVHRTRNQQDAKKQDGKEPGQHNAGSVAFIRRVSPRCPIMETMKGRGAPQYPVASWFRRSIGALDKRPSLHAGSAFYTCSSSIPSRTINGFNIQTVRDLSQLYRDLQA